MTDFTFEKHDVMPPPDPYPYCLVEMPTRDEGSYWAIYTHTSLGWHVCNNAGYPFDASRDKEPVIYDSKEEAQTACAEFIRQWLNERDLKSIILVPKPSTTES